MKCEHDYKMMKEDVKTGKIKCPVSGIETGTRINGYAVFYCAKCLDIQKKVL